eukprot:17547-Heterococcus_DN1.PRE.2
MFVPSESPPSSTTSLTAEVGSMFCLMKSVHLLVPSCAIFALVLQYEQACGQCSSLRDVGSLGNVRLFCEDNRTSSSIAVYGENAVPSTEQEDMHSARSLLGGAIGGVTNVLGGAANAVTGAVTGSTSAVLNAAGSAVH